MNSSARHSDTDLMFLKEASLAPVVKSTIAWLTLLRGETSIAYLLTVPPDPILVESSLAPQLATASTMTLIGFSPVRRWMTSIVCCMILTANCFFPLFLPFLMTEFTTLSMSGHWTFLNFLVWYFPAVCGMKT